MSEPKLTIGICSGGTIRCETVTSLVTNMINLAQKDIMTGLLFQVGGYVDINRNKIVEACQKNGTTHLIFIDADMTFPDDGIFRLLEQDKDIIGANYNVRLDPTSKAFSGPTVKMLVNGQPVSMITLPKKLFKCYALPTGFMMIKMDVFDKLEKPYFDAWIGKNNEHHTEDIDFCRKAQEQGIEIWCDPTIKMGHIGSYMY